MAPSPLSIRQQQQQSSSSGALPDGLLDDAALAALAARWASSWDAPPPAAPLRYPLRFASVAAETNFIAVMHLLQFGEHYASWLAQDVRMSPRRCIERGLVGLHICGGRLDASRLLNVTITEVETLFGIPLTYDERLQSAPATISKPTRLRAFAAAIHKQLHEAGLKLRCLGVDDFGEFVAKNAGDSASTFVSRLADAFPAFNDVAKVDATTVPFFSKAQALARALFVRFQDDRDSAVSAWRDVDDLGICVDAKLLRSLLAAGVLHCAASDDKQLSAEHLNESSVKLRTAAISAVFRLAELMQSEGVNVTIHQLERVFRKQAVSQEQAGDRGEPLPSLNLPESLFF